MTNLSWIGRLMHATPLNKGFGREYRARPAFGIVLAAALFSAALSSAGVAPNTTDRNPTEYEVKAAYIYYFAKFVNWPDDAFAAPNAPLTVGVLGDNEFASLLETVVKEKTVQDRSISVRLLKWPSDLRSCHILYISASELKRFKQITEQLGARPVLTITEADSASQTKGIMNLFVDSGKVQFEIDITGADKAHLQISSKLLRLARGTQPGRLGKGE